TRRTRRDRMRLRIVRIEGSALRHVAAAGCLVAASLAGARAVRAMPAPGPFRVIDPTPPQGGVVTTRTVELRLDPACTFDPNTLAVTVNGNTIPTSSFLPFSACTNNRITSQTVNVAITLPNGTISSAPTTLNKGDSASFSGSGTGDGLSWNFDGGAPPATGS